MKLFTEGLFPQGSEPAAALRHILNRISDGFVALDKDWCFTYLNQKGTEVFDRPEPGQLVEKNIWKEYPHLVGGEFYNSLQRSLQTQQYICLEIFSPFHQKWFEDHIYPSEEGLTIYFRDITGQKQALLDLHASETKYRRIVEAAQEGIWMVNEEDMTTFVNSKMAAMLGYRPEEMIGRPVYDFVQPEERLQAKEALDRRRRGLSEHHEFTLRSKQGGPVWTLISTNPMIENYQYKGALAMVTDIGERKRTEQALREREEQYRQLFHSLPLPAWVVDQESHQFLAVNEAAIRHYGYTRQEFLAMKAERLLPATGSGNAAGSLLVATGRLLDHRGIEQHRRKNGSTLEVEMVGHDTFYEKRPARLALANDITEKRGLERDMQQINEELHTLSNHLQNIREEERINIAREIHDELGQQLTGLKMEVHWLNKRLPPGDFTARNRITDILSLIDDTIKSVRRIASELRPSILDDLGLVAALEWLSQEVARRSEIIVNFCCDMPEPELAASVKTGLFRIYQEALTNALRHSRARTVSSTLQLVGNRLELEVSDDGIGLDPGAREKKTFGLLGIQERTYALGGALEINSEPGKGTTLLISVPLHS
ncbi:PAS domain S-box protein [Paraflavisolibacter sp. H34]|uniref:PAS domain-containing sensor histidine kinase n=1 Tax=Huijunlia imazamoxiresistens TaxID=3127457 RepID=UPI0030197893